MAILARKEWINRRLRKDESVWAAFSNFLALYQRLKMGWITEAGQLRPEKIEKRLAYLIKNTRAGKMYGTVPILEETILTGAR